MTRIGLTSLRIAAAASFCSPESARPQAFADAVYRRAVSASLGATVTVALHRVQRNRLTFTTISTGGPSGSSGPQN